MRFPWLSKTPRTRHKPLLQVPFYGQDALLTTLAEHLQAAQAGTPQFVLVEGPSGSGKTALLEEFALLRGARPEILLGRVNVADCVLVEDFYRQVFLAFQTRSERIFQTAYNDTKRLRKARGLSWDEQEFRQVITAADWTAVDDASTGERATSRRPAPLATLLASVRQHPWTVGAATILNITLRGLTSSVPQRSWPQHWAALLQSVQGCLRPTAAVMVLLIDQVEAPLALPETLRQAWQEGWHDFATATMATSSPLLVIWAGTPESGEGIRRAMPPQLPFMTCHLTPLADDAYAAFLRRLVRVLPRATQAAWQQELTDLELAQRSPARLLLATAGMVAAGTGQGEKRCAELRQATVSSLVDTLLQTIAGEIVVPPALLRQLVEAWAFLPPGKHVPIEHLLTLCDLEALGLDPVAGRTHLEKLLGQGVRYGLWHYDPYAERYTADHRDIQDALQQWAYPDEATRRDVALRRRVASAILHHVQQGERQVLEALAQLLSEMDAPEGPMSWEAVLVAPFRRLLPMCDKTERLRMAAALGGFTSPWAVDLLQLMLHDEDGQVRSSVVQSLADAGAREALPVLIEALSDPNSDVRWIAAQALGAITAATTVNALIPMLMDQDKEVGRIAAEGLGRQGDVRAVPHLIAAMRESYPLLRESAALALAQLADARAVPALQDMLHDANLQVRRSAEHALARLTASP